MTRFFKERSQSPELWQHSLALAFRQSWRVVWIGSRFRRFLVLFFLQMGAKGPAMRSFPLRSNVEQTPGQYCYTFT